MALRRPDHALTRRELLAGTASALLLASCRGGSAGEVDPATFLRYMARRVPLPDKRGLGAQFLEQDPVENDLEALIRLVFGERSGSSDVSRWIDHFDDAVAEDSSQGRLLLVEGWLAPLTELRFCALTHLLHPS